MRADFNLYVRRDSWLHRLDPRPKFLFVVVASFWLFGWPAIGAALAIIALCTALLWSAHIPARPIRRTWNMMAPLVLLVFTLTALFGGGAGPAWFYLGPLAVTQGSVVLGAMLALRLLALALAIFVLLFTTDQAMLVRGLLALKVPYEWGLTLALALRYLPVFAGLFAQVRDAQQARGLDLEQRRFMQRLRAYRPVLIAMIISALRQSERLGWALEARALGAAGVRRSTFRPLRLRRIDIFVLTLLALILVAGVVLRLL